MQRSPGTPSSRKSAYSRSSLSHVLACRLPQIQEIHCAGIIAGSCVGEICDRFSECFSKVMQDTNDEWNVPVVAVPVRN